MLTATMAAGLSYKPMRTVFLARSWPDIQQLVQHQNRPGVLTCCLATLHVEDGALRNELPHLQTQTTTPPADLCLYIVENSLASNYYGTASAKALSKLDKVSNLI